MKYKAELRGEPKRLAKYKRDRIKHGLSKQDAWNLYSFLQTVVANALDEMVKNTISYPVDIDVDVWNDKILAASVNANFLVEYEEKSQAIYDKHMGNVTHTTEPITEGKFQGYYSFKSNDTIEQRAAWLTAEAELTAERNIHKDELFDFLKEHFYELWD